MTKSKVISPTGKCPHCGKAIYVQFAIDHRHSFEHKVETINDLKGVTIQKADVK
jgi:hypothetical protein